MILKVVIESIRQAAQQLSSNKLRTFLSLLGITIGIFCIISVKSAVDSLENNIRTSFEKLGNDVLYISKMPWIENPRENYWKYFQRPNPDMEDLERVERQVESAEKAALSVFLSRAGLKYKSNSLERAFLIGVTYDYSDILKISYEKGRWMSRVEYESGHPLAVLGNVVAEELFGKIEPMGKEVKIKGKKFKVIGVIEKSGNDIINPVDFDRAVILGRNAAKTIANVKTKSIFGTSLMVKAKDGFELNDLRDEVTGVLRAERRLKPKEKNNFAINELSILSSILDSFFGVLNLAGFIIGLFAILVGMFSVANIMFVSVKERTKIIGIKKALGAKRGVVLLEFLVEATVICIIGGLMGIGLVYLVMAILSQAIEFEMFLSIANVSWGLGLSIVIGILSGLLPALQASNMDPVEAMRH